MASAVTIPGRRKASLLWVQGLTCGALLTFATPTALLLAVLLAPALLCLIAELDGRGTLRAVALFSAAAAVHPLWMLWMQSDRLDVAVNALSNPATLALAWGAGAIGWALCQVLPISLRSVWEARKATRAAAVTTEIMQLREEWDL